MMILIVLGIIICLALCFAWVKFVYWIFSKLESKHQPAQPIEKEKGNPYIAYQLFKEKNDKDYQEYLEWMNSREDAGVPIKKLQAREDREAEEKIKKLIGKSIM
jgi:hypothetical protein